MKSSLAKTVTNYGTKELIFNDETLWMKEDKGLSQCVESL